LAGAIDLGEDSEGAVEAPAEEVHVVYDLGAFLLDFYG
jgi:hypothetical protein